MNVRKLTKVELNPYDGPMEYDEYCIAQEIEEQRDEMLEALIRTEIEAEQAFLGLDDRNLKIIEKATGLSWEEVNRLLEVENTEET